MVPALPPPALSSTEWQTLTLVKKELLTTGANPTALYRFAFADPSQHANLPVASCLLTRVPVTKKDGTPGFAVRPYTPISAPTSAGFLDLAVKTYVDPPGVMSSHMAEMKEGDTLEFKGPIVKLSLEKIVGQGPREIGMVAGGTGLTPMLQIAEEILREGALSSVSMHLLFANVAEEDIIVRDRLDALARRHPDQFKVTYFVEKPSAAWRGETGRVSGDALRRLLPPPREGSLVLVCGPPPMMAAVSGAKLKDGSQGELSGMLKDLGYSSSLVFKF